MTFGNYSGGLIAPLSNPSTYTSFSFIANVGGGFAIIPLLESEIDGKLLKFVASGTFTNGSGSTDPTIYISFGDASTFPTGSTQVGSYSYNSRGAGTFPFSITALARYDSTTGKLYSVATSLDANNVFYSPSATVGSTSQTMASQTAYQTFVAANFSVLNAGNVINLDEFKVSLA